MTTARRWLAVLALGALVGCASEAGSPTAPATTDAPASVAPAPSVASPASAPATSVEATVFAEGVISTDEEEYRISFAPDGATALFARGPDFFPQTRQATIMQATLVDGEWSEPTVASFSGTYPDLDPWFAPDGESVYFSSIRPIAGEPRTDAEIFRVDRSGNGWGEPVHLPELGSERDELGASVDADGTIWFASDRPGGAGGWDLYVAEPAGEGFEEPDPVGAVNSPVWEFNPAISADGTALVFTSIDREGGSGLGDLYVTVRAGGEWSDAAPIAINSSADEYHASVSADGGTLYFVRRLGDGDLYEVAWSGPASER